MNKTSFSPSALVLGLGISACGSAPTRPDTVEPQLPVKSVAEQVSEAVSACAQNYVSKAQECKKVADSTYPDDVDTARNVCFAGGRESFAQCLDAVAKPISQTADHTTCDTFTPGNYCRTAFSDDTVSSSRKAVCEAEFEVARDRCLGH